MLRQVRSATCQRCGSGFVLTATYDDLLERRGIKVTTPLLCPTCFLTKGPMPKKHGEVKWFNPRKRFGFIVSDEGEELFFHERQLVAEDDRHPREGETVRFHVHYPIKGPEALNVELISD
ncbi:MAG: cold shock domain-containing protein [Anaerolineae bacterium]|nr:cold shock domain-containing protein [Anaerolineae bacterium]